MARVSLQDVVFPGWFAGIAERDGFYVYQTGTATAATVYLEATGATTVTPPIPFYYNRMNAGFVNAGEYTFSAGARTFTADVTGGNQAIAPLPSDDFLSVYNACPQECIPSVAATTTSQTIKFVRIVPDKKITAAQVVLVSGTAVA